MSRIETAMNNCISSAEIRCVEHSRPYVPYETVSTIKLANENARSLKIWGGRVLCCLDFLHLFPVESAHPIAHNNHSHEHVVGK